MTPLGGPKKSPAVVPGILAKRRPCGENRILGSFEDCLANCTRPKCPDHLFCIALLVCFVVPLSNLQQMIVFFVACADASVPTENVVSTTFAVLRFEIGTKNRRVSNCAAMS